LGKVLDIPYLTLMELAGYAVLESTLQSDPVPLGDASFAHAIDSTDLSENERNAVAAFIAHLRDQRPKGPT
jgi:hypothetical protein